MWSDTVDEVLDADQAVGFAYVTPALGVVVAPVTNFAMHDREAGTVAVNTSVGAGRKLERVARNPSVALAFHTRSHSRTSRTEYALVQGTASLSEPIDDYPTTVRERWERAAGRVADGPVGRRWLRVYHRRVEISVTVERVVVWPDLGCRGAFDVHGAPLPEAPPTPQAPPKNGTGSRIAHRRAARRARRMPDLLLGWVGTDGLPVVVPVGIAEVVEDALVLDAPAGLVPPGGRRAGLTAHRFSRHVVGQRQQIHTGWLDADADTIRYFPHTHRAYWMPASRAVYNVAVGFETRRRARAQ